MGICFCRPKHEEEEGQQSRKSSHEEHVSTQQANGSTNEGGAGGGNGGKPQKQHAVIYNYLKTNCKASYPQVTQKPQNETINLTNNASLVPFSNNFKNTPPEQPNYMKFDNPISANQNIDAQNWSLWNNQQQTVQPVPQPQVFDERYILESPVRSMVHDETSQYPSSIKIFNEHTK